MGLVLSLESFAGTPDAVWRVYKFLADKPGPHHRDRIMHWTGFPDPKREPVCAYASFAAAVDRLNARLKHYDQRVAGGLDTGENYHLEVTR